MEGNYFGQRMDPYQQQYHAQMQQQRQQAPQHQQQQPHPHQQQQQQIQLQRASSSGHGAPPLPVSSFASNLLNPPSPVISVNAGEEKKGRGRPRGSTGKNKKSLKLKPKGRKRSRSSDLSDEEEEDLESEPESEKGMDEDGEQDLSADETTFATTTKFGRQTQRPKPVILSVTPSIPRKKSKKASIEPSAEPQYADIFAECCRQGHSTETNALVLCDGCDKGYHQQCPPGITDEELAREKWFCKACQDQKLKDFPPIDLSTTVNDEGLTRYDKEDYLNSLPIITLANLVISMEEKYAARLGESSLEIWPTGLVAVLAQKKLDDIEKRRIAFESSAELDRLEKEEELELQRLEMEEERGKAAATLNDLANNNTPAATTPHSDSLAQRPLSEIPVNPIDPAVQLDTFRGDANSQALHQMYQMHNQQRILAEQQQQQQHQHQQQHQPAYNPYPAGNPYLNFSNHNELGQAGLSPSDVESILKELGP